MRRLILVPLLIFLALAAIGGAIAYWIYNNYNYYSTDDAQISGPVVNVSAPVAGTLTTLSVKLGDKVTAGQTIGSITPATSTTAKGEASSVSLDLTSPTNGTILQVPAVQGQNVAPGLTLAVLTDPSAVTVTAYVDENAINNVNVGQAVDIHIDAYSDTSFTGHVEQIVQATAGTFSLLPNQDPTSGNFTKVGQRIPVVITLDATASKAILPGMSAEVTIHLH
ncbi:MAG TPA: HlyD family efflux transporter periplasmic adaptor subunit [Ktedonobacteraceae bacterium]|nr:HlyD family efflux transporter periplasmic adaptor subunit [Ktedonobacteraceae bacterium]